MICFFRSIDSRQASHHDFSAEIIHHAGILISSSYTVIENSANHPFAKSHVSLGSWFHPCQLHADTLHCTCLRANQVWSLVDVQWRSGKRGKPWGKTDFTPFPADLVDPEIMPRGGFASFSSSVCETLLTRKHVKLFNLKKKRSGRIASNRFFERERTTNNKCRY